MAQVQLSSNLVRSHVCPAGKSKVDLFDSYCKGLVLEVRHSGGRTYYVRYLNPHGVTRQLKLADAADISLAQARQLATKVRQKAAMGEDPAAEKEALRQVPTFAEFVSERYLPYIKVDKRSWMSDDSYLRNHLLPAFAKYPMDTISKRQVIEFHHGMRESGYAAGTVNRCLILLRYIFNLAIRWEIPGIIKNPTSAVPLLKDETVCERYLSKDEVQRLYAALQNSDNQLLLYIIQMLLLTGARKREVLDARWEDFNLERRQWKIPRSKVGPRFVPISEAVVELLGMIPRRHDCPLLFPSPATGKPFVSIFYSWDTARHQAGLADVRIHDLRHSFASFLINGGRSLYEVQKILGHTQIRTTQKYAHLSRETLIEAANAAVNSIGRVLGSNGLRSSIPAANDTPTPNLPEAA